MAVIRSAIVFEVFSAVTWRVTPDPILANQLLNCAGEAGRSVMRQMQILQIQVGNTESLVKQ